MKNFLTFVFYGLLFTLPGEVLNQISFHNDAKGFMSVAVIYIIFLSIVYIFMKFLNKQFKRPFFVALTGYLVIGFIGLMIEWILISHAPWSSDADQIGMFTFWGSMFLGPLILMNHSPENQSIKRKLTTYFIIFSLVYNVIALTGNVGKYIGLIVFTYGTWVLNYFFVKYLWALKKQNT